MVSPTATAHGLPSLSVAYLLLLYRQANPARCRVSARSIRAYLDFCVAHQLGVGPWSRLLFAEQTGGRTTSGLSNWLLFYEQIGGPPLLTPACLAATVSLGAYPCADLVRFWQWQQYGDPSSRMKAIRVALFRWLTYLQDTDRTGALCLDDVSRFMAYLGQSGRGALAIEQQLLAIREWANWLGQSQVGLELAVHQKALLRCVGQLTLNNDGDGLTSSVASPDWYILVYTYRVDVAAPAIETLLSRGIPCVALASLRVGQLRFRYVDDLVIQLDNRRWTFLSYEARLVRRYLEAGDRWGYCWSIPDQPLFMETDWATLWPLARQWLGQTRLKRRLERNQNHHLPAWSAMNWGTLFARSGA